LYMKVLVGGTSPPAAGTLHVLIHPSSDKIAI